MATKTAHKRKPVSRSKRYRTKYRTIKRKVIRELKIWTVIGIVAYIAGYMVATRYGADLVMAP